MRAPPAYPRRLRRKPESRFRARSSAVEHYLDMVGVTGSIPVVPTKFGNNKAAAGEGSRVAVFVCPGTTSFFSASAVHMRDVRRWISRVAMDVFRNVAPVRYKNRMELQYWIGRHEQEGQLSGPHYEHFYTSFFGLDRRALPGGCVFRQPRPRGRRRPGHCGDQARHGIGRYLFAHHRSRARAFTDGTAKPAPIDRPSIRAGVQNRVPVHLRHSP